LTYFWASNSIVANSPLGGACVNDGDATVDDQGHNIIQAIECISDPTSQTSDPMLGPLQHNGGATHTHAPSPGSPAIDGGDTASCPDADQRGVPRPLDGDGNGTAVCDIGSLEYVQFTGSLYLPIVSR
jgi:hypothetical protein